MKKYVDQTQLPADYIIERGITDGWEWEKWLSGKYVCYKIYSEILNYYTQVPPFYGYVTSIIKYPIVFVEQPIVRYNARVASGFAIPGGDVAGTQSYFRGYALSTYTQPDANCTFEIEVIGKWK